ncbi:hypothetical protein MCHI_003853, partial [Candidatus Magnetoovum chiemensis]
FPENQTGNAERRTKGGASISGGIKRTITNITQVSKTFNREGFALDMDGRNSGNDSLDEECEKYLR